MNMNTPTNTPPKNLSLKLILSEFDWSKLPWQPVSTMTSVLLVLWLIFSLLFPSQPTFTISGIVQAKEVKNASRLGGRIKQVLVKEGDTVEQDQPLIVFDDTEMRAKISSARASLTQAEAQEAIVAQGPDKSDIKQAQAQVQQAEENFRMLSRGGRPEELDQADAKLREATARYNTAKASLDNAAKMLHEGIISQQRYDDISGQFNASKSSLDTAKASLQLLKKAPQEQILIAKAQLKAAQAQFEKLTKGAKPGEVQIAKASVEQANSALGSLEAQQSELIIKSPIPGFISSITVNPGELIQPGRPVVSIIDYESLWTDIYVPEDKLDFLQLRDEVKVLSPVYPGTEFKGQIVTINPKSEFVPGSSTSNNSEQPSFRVKIHINNTDTNGKKHLNPGMRVNVIFTQKQK